MKRFLPIILTIILFVTGCAKPAPVAPTQPTTAPTGTTAATVPSTPAVIAKQAPMCAVTLNVITQEEKADDGTVIFTGIYQNMALTIPEPEVADKVIIDFLNLTDISQQSQPIMDAAKEAHKEGYLTSPYLCSITFTPKRIDNGVLSLLGTASTYQGGAHPDSVNKAVTYDLLTGNSLYCSGIMLETVTSADLLPLIYEALEDQKDSLYEGYESMVKDKFSHGIDQNTDWFFSEDGLCFFFSPYEIGPFASGTILAQIPYGKLSGLLRDDYFPAERDIAAGKLQAIPYAQATLSDYSQFAEVTVTPGASKILLVTDNSIQDIRIVRNQTSAEGISSSHTVFAAYGLTPGDAIVVETDAPLEVTYTTSTQTITETIQAQ